MLRFEVLRAVQMSVLVLWVVTPCGLVGRYQRFGGTFCFHLQDLSPEDGSGMFIRNYTNLVRESGMGYNNVYGNILLIEQYFYTPMCNILSGGGGLIMILIGHEIITPTS
jgi:hypothetical protein